MPTLPKKTAQHDILQSDFFVLAIGLSVAAGAYLMFRGQVTLQAVTVVATGLFYILWGTIHHLREGDLHITIVIEYTLIAVLAMTLLLTLLFRA